MPPPTTTTSGELTLLSMGLMLAIAKGCQTPS
jgi:hypothetical protein